VSLADKLDTIVGLFAAGEKPTGSRDPYALRRAAQGVVKILVDLPGMGIPAAQKFDLAPVLQEAYAPHAKALSTSPDLWATLGLPDFLWERLAHLLERRGHKGNEIRVVAAVPEAWANPFDVSRRVDAIAKTRSAPEVQALAALFKRVKNITKNLDDDGASLSGLQAVLKEPAEIALAEELERRWDEIAGACVSGKFVDAIRALSQFSQPVDQFFTDVLVMAEEPQLRKARLALLLRLRSAVLRFFGDISELAAEDGKSG